MRRVLVGGKEFSIPRDQTYHVRNEERLDWNRSAIVTEFTFHPEPNAAVSIRTCERSDYTSMVSEPESVVAEQWMDRPSRDLADFLLVDPHGENPCATAYYPNNYYHRDVPLKGKKKNPQPTRRSAVLPRPMYALDNAGDYMSSENRGKAEEYKEMMTRMKGLNIDEEKLHALKRDRHIEELLKEKGKGGPMAKKFPTGTRVMFRHSRTKKSAYATVVGVVKEMKGNTHPGTILLCTDEAVERAVHHEEYTGAQHGLLVDYRKSGVELLMGSRWHTVPHNIGVYVRDGFVHDGVEFHSSGTGRIMGDIDHERGVVTVSWNWSNENFHTSVDDGGTEWSNSWEVPVAELGMCLLSEDKNMLARWPIGFSTKPATNWKVGDICVVAVAGRHGVNFVTKEGREAVLPDGTVVELLKNAGGSHQIWNAKIMGCCPESMVGSELNVREMSLMNHPHPEMFYRPGQMVEIVAKMDFRKTSLQGMKGKVILSTDTDGDVGIEFKENIDAGSLDGIGKEGHCIYIEASLVKSSE